MIEAREHHVPIARPGTKAAAILAVAVHVFLALFLIYGVHWQNSMPAAVEVDLVRSVPSAAPQKSVEPVREPVPEPKPVQEPPKPKPEPKPEPIKPPPKPDIAIKDKEKPKPEKKPEPKPAFDPIQDALKKEMEQTRRQQMNNAASQELSQMQSTSARGGSKSKADYAGRISAKVRGNLMVPPGVSGNPEAEFRVNQLPSGEVIDVKLKRSSGVKALDEAIERAIYKSSPLPKPERQDDFDRMLDFKFRPLESSSVN